MAYNSYLPSYYPNYQQYPNNPSQGISQPQSGIVWVQGVEGAKAYPVGANNSVLLMDSESSVFYIKSTDSSGMPMPLRIFEYQEHREPESVQSDYVTRAELDEAIARITESKKKKEAKNE